jgi:hypothetical protein
MMRHTAERPTPACVNSLIEPPQAIVIRRRQSVLKFSAWYTIYDSISGCQVIRDTCVWGEIAGVIGRSDALPRGDVSLEKKLTY